MVGLLETRLKTRGNVARDSAQNSKAGSEQDSRNLIALSDDLAAQKFLLLHSPALLAFATDCLNKSFSI